MGPYRYFNTILFPHECKGGACNPDLRGMREFREIVHRCSLIDVERTTLGKVGQGSS